MSELLTIHYGDEPGHAHADICRPRFVQYIGRVKRGGARRWDILCRTDSREHAYRTVAEAMATGDWKRGDVLGDEGPESYYDPIPLIEMR